MRLIFVSALPDLITLYPAPVREDKKPNNIISLESRVFKFFLQKFALMSNTSCYGLTTPPSAERKKCMPFV